MRHFLFGACLLPCSFAWAQPATDPVLLKDPIISHYLEFSGLMDAYRYLADTAQYTSQKTEYHLQRMESVCQNRASAASFVQYLESQKIKLDVSAADVKDVVEVECYQLKKQLGKAQTQTRFPVRLSWPLLTHPVKGANGWETYQRELKKLYSLETLTDPDLIKIKKQLLDDWQRCGESTDRFAELYAGDAAKKAIMTKFLGYLADGVQKATAALRSDTVRIDLSFVVERYSERDWRLLQPVASCSSGFLAFRSTLYCPSPTDHCNTFLLDFQDDKNAFQHLLCLTLLPDQPKFVRNPCYLHAFADFYINEGATIVRMPKEAELDAFLAEVQAALRKAPLFVKMVK